MLKQLCCIVGIAALAVAASAQSTPAAKPDFSKEGYVVERRATKLVFENDGSGTEEDELRLRIQSDAGVKRFGQLAFAFPSSSEKLDIVYVRVRKPDGSVIVTPPGNVLELPADVTREAPLYSDLHEKHVTVKALNLGDTLEVLLRKQTTTPLVPGQFWASYDFDKDEIALDDELEISVPRERAVTLKSPTLKPVVTEEGARRTYTWKSTNLARRRPEEQPRRRAGHTPLPDVQLTTFSTWEQVGRWYAELQKERTTPTAEMRARVAELTRDAKSDDEKLLALYKYVSTRFRYVALEFGVGRYQPHPAEDVFANEYGDCKDKHTLLAALAQAAGITVYPALVNDTRDLDPEMPSPAQFDHVITAFARGDRYTWMDTTAEVAPMGLVSPTLRGKQALVVTSSGAPALVTIPAAPVIANEETFQADAKLSAEGVLEGRMAFDSQGDDAMLFRLMFRRVPQAQWKDAVQQLSYNLGYGGEVNDVQAQAPEDFGDAFRFSYHYRRPDYSDWQNRRITPPFPPSGILPEWKDDDKTPGPLLLGSTIDVDLRAIIELPSGANPTLPKTVQLSTDFADYEARYSLKNGTLYCERHLVVKKDEIPTSAKRGYQKFQKALQDDITSYIDLGLKAPVDANSAEVQRLIEQSRTAWQKEEYREATTYLKRAAELDPKNPVVWTGLGMLAENLKDIEGMMRAYSKSAELDPTNVKVKRLLVNAYLVANRREDAARVLSQIVALTKQDTVPITSDNAKPEDIPILEAELKEHPDNPTVSRSLGNAYLRAGKVDEGLTALGKAVELDPGPVPLANVVFEMMNRHNRADDALQLAKNVLDEAESASAKVSLDSIQTEDLVRISRLAAYWGIMGWIYLRQGDLPKAESYLNSAWLLSQDPVTGGHLGALYEKQYKPAAAMRMYTLALGGTTGVLPPSSLEDDRESMQHRLKQLRTGRSSPAADAVGELSRMRKIHLPSVKGKGSAEFFLLIGPSGKVEEVKFISGAGSLRAAAAALESAKLNISFPAGSTAKLIRRGILVCPTEIGCDFVMVPPDSVSAN